ncbi:uncharacterized protein LOC111389199 [Olea europaea var. sylvestris]|uniref:uncharacterized protein LOC111389199 n=1 Tax=Olea europaea var. sylvestris TaxID=158386 RepID=UPI000C1D4EA5|nr:uncharacterized protein LOC111389199 [Olea europaea var. sylvestris]
MKDICEMQKMEDEAKLRMQTKAGKRVPLPSNNMGSKDCYVLEERKRKNSAIENAFNVTTRDQLDFEIARMFYSSGLPFTLARNPYYISSYTLASNSRISGYLPPSYNKLRTTLLQKEKKNVERLLNPIKGTWVEKGVTIVSDGWSDPQRRPLINFMAVTESGPMFLKAVDCSGETKDKYFIANLMKEVINEIGHQKVVQVITDNAPNCKGAGQIIELEYPHIFWTPCVVHTLNLALKNICAAKNVENNLITYEECNWITNLHDDVMIIKNFIMNHSMRLAMFNEFVPLKLLSVAKTRFASIIAMLKRFKLIQRGLQALVISEKWSLYREDDMTKASFVKLKVFDDLWWDSISYVLSFTSPIYDMLRFCDTDKPCLHLVYDMWNTMIEKVRGIIYRNEKKVQEEELSFYNVVHRILVDRWNKNNTPLHCLSHSLNPRYYSEEWLNEDPTRLAPHRDVEISRERIKCFKRYLSNEERIMVNKEYAKFSTMEDDFGDFESIHDRYRLDPKTWWVIYGACTPMLQSYALRLLGQPFLHRVVSEIGVLIPFCTLLNGIS